MNPQFFGWMIDNGFIQPKKLGLPADSSKDLVLARAVEMDRDGTLKDSGGADIKGAVSVFYNLNVRNGG